MLEIFFKQCILTVFHSVTGNTRVISQNALDHFRTSLTAKTHDPYSVLLRKNKLPMAFIDETKNPHAQKV
jgi:nuclear GTP-binding protein